MFTGLQYTLENIYWLTSKKIILMSGCGNIHSVTLGNILLV